MPKVKGPVHDSITPFGDSDDKPLPDMCARCKNCDNRLWKEKMEDGVCPPCVRSQQVVSELKEKGDVRMLELEGDSDAVSDPDVIREASRMIGEDDISEYRIQILWSRKSCTRGHVYKPDDLVISSSDKTIRRRCRVCSEYLVRVGRPSSKSSGL